MDTPDRAFGKEGGVRSHRSAVERSACRVMSATCSADGTAHSFQPIRAVTQKDVEEARAHDARDAEALMRQFASSVKMLESVADGAQTRQIEALASFLAECGDRALAIGGALGADIADRIQRVFKALREDARASDAPAEAREAPKEADAVLWAAPRKRDVGRP